MLYVLIAFFVIYFICSLPRVLHYSRESEKAKKAIREKEEISAKLELITQDYDKENGKLSSRLRLSNEEISNLRYSLAAKDKKINELKAQNTAMETDIDQIIYDIELKGGKRYPASEIIQQYERIYMLEEELAHVYHDAISTIRKETWGDLLSEHGQSKYKTRTISESVEIHYPNLKPDRVYYLLKGKSYHSVPWCYTLDHSSNIYSTSLWQAEKKGLERCSKCVDVAQYEERKMQHEE